MRNKLAMEIASNLMFDLRYGKLKKIGIEEITAAIKAHPSYPELNEFALERLLEATTRAVVEGAARG